MFVFNSIVVKRKTQGFVYTDFKFIYIINKEKRRNIPVRKSLLFIYYIDKIYLSYSAAFSSVAGVSVAAGAATSAEAVFLERRVLVAFFVAFSFNIFSL